MRANNILYNIYTKLAAVVSNNRVLIGLVLLFILARLTFLLFAYPYIFWHEDITRGVLAHEAVSGGTILPLFNYQVDNYSGGSLLIGLLVIPFFYFLGQSAFVLKLVGLSVSCLALIVWYRFCTRHFNRTTALLFALLYIFAPFGFVRETMVTMGYHSESVLFTAIVVSLFYNIFFSGAAKRSSFFIIGLVCGLGLWFTYIFGLTLFCILLCWLFYDRLFFLRKTFGIFIIGFFFGFIPWIIYNLYFRFQGLTIQGTPISEMFSLSRLLDIATARESIFYIIPLSMELPRIPYIGYLIPAVFYGMVIFLSALFLLDLSRPRVFVSRLWPPLCYCVIFCFIYQIFARHYNHYLVVLYPFLFLIIAISVNKILNFKPKLLRLFGIILFSLLILIGIHSVTANMSSSYRGYGLRSKGYSYELFTYSQQGHSLSSLPKILYILDRLEIRDQNALLESVASDIDTSQPDIDQFLVFASQAATRHKRWLYFIVGGAAYSSLLDGAISADKFRLILSSADSRYRDALYYGAIDPMASFDSRQQNHPAFLVNSISNTTVQHQYIARFYYVLGNASLPNGLERGITIPVFLDPDYEKYFYEGVGSQLAASTVGNYSSNKVVAPFAVVSPTHRDSILRGAGQYLGFLVVRDSANTILLNDFLAHLPDDASRGFCQRGVEQAIKCRHLDYYAPILFYQ